MTIKTFFIVIGLLIAGCAFGVYQKHMTPDAAWVPIDDARAFAPTSVAKSVIQIQLSGAVVRPGVYEIAAGSRVSDVLAMAGGATTAANLERVNLAGKLRDGQHIKVPVLKQKRTKKPTHASGVAVVYLNHDSVETLTKLPLMTAPIAEQIVTYREKNGPFFQIEDLKKVKGISAKKIDAWRPYCRL